MGFFFSHGNVPASQWLPATKSMLEKGEDPKEMLIEVCRPQCHKLEEKLHRCELKLKDSDHSDHEKSCMYPHRDWVTCVDACVITKIQPNLVGQQSGWIS